MLGFVNYETEYNALKLKYEQLGREAAGKNELYLQLRAEFEKMCARLPEYEEMKVLNERIKERNGALEKDNSVKASYISGLQMKLVTAMSEIERMTVFGN